MRSTDPYKRLTGPPPMCTGPKDVPDLRQWLAMAWMPGNPFYATAGLHSARASRDPVEADAIGRWNWLTMKAADLWWVQGEMVDMLNAAAADLPAGSAHLTEELVPVEPAFVVFEHPLLGIDARPSEYAIEAAKEQGLQPGTVMVNALSWGWANLPEQGRCLAITTYRRWSGGELEGWWVPLGHSDWKLGRDWSEPIHHTVTGASAASHAEDRRWVTALWALASQANLVVGSRLVPQRQVRRRAQRAGFPDPTVRLVALRRSIVEGGQRFERVDSETGARTFHVRWTVRGHWRQQAYGRGRKFRRPVWIAPFVKGPEGAPLKEGSIVRVLR